MLFCRWCVLVVYAERIVAIDFHLASVVWLALPIFFILLGWFPPCEWQSFLWLCAAVAALSSTWTTTWSPQQLPVLRLFLSTSKLPTYLLLACGAFYLLTRTCALYVGRRLVLYWWATAAGENELCVGGMWLPSCYFVQLSVFLCAICPGWRNV